MAKQRLVTLDGGGDGSDFTNIRATIPLHLLRVYQDGVRDVSFVYKTKADDFTQEFETEVGDIIRLVGHGWQGFLGRPPGYNAEEVPPTVVATTGDSGGGDIVLKIRCSTLATPDVVVFESEGQQDE